MGVEYFFLLIYFFDFNFVEVVFCKIKNILKGDKYIIFLYVDLKVVVYEVFKEIILVDILLFFKNMEYINF